MRINLTTKVFFILSIMTVFAVNVFMINQKVVADCGGAKTSIIDCGVGRDDKTGEMKNNAVWKLVEAGVKILTGGVVVAALGGIVWGSILYTSAGGNAETKQKAILTLTNVAIGVVSYVAMYAILNFIIPGGVDIL